MSSWPWGGGRCADCADGGGGGGGDVAPSAEPAACHVWQAWFHPSSINASPAKAEGGLFVYVEKVGTVQTPAAMLRPPLLHTHAPPSAGQVDTSRLFLRATTRVPPAALLLFGATASELDIERVKQCGRVDLASGARVRVSPEVRH